MMIIYLASPYSSYANPQDGVDVQIDTFAILRDLGYQPIAPLLSHYVDQRHPASYERWMQWCLAMVSVADLVVRLPGESKGADLEVAEAKRRGIPVVYGVESAVNHYPLPGVYVNDELSGAPYSDITPAMREMAVSALRQIHVMLRCIQRPTVPYDKDALTMAQAAVGYCGEMAAQIETLLPKDVSEQ